MPRFFFDISAGGLTLDDEGAEFPNAHAARDEAIKALPDIVRGEIAQGRGRDVWVLMRSEGGRPIFTASLTFTDKWLVDNA